MFRSQNFQTCVCASFGVELFFLPLFFHADADRLLKKEPFFPHRNVFRFRQQVHWVEQELVWLNLPDVDNVIDNGPCVKSVWNLSF
jgi:hypothetical protein